jgi:hypothetical protein
MVRCKDKNTTKTGKLDGTVPLKKLPTLMKVIGYYPIKAEVRNITDEVKFSVCSGLGDPTNSVEIDSFIRLFINHRPIYGISKKNIEGAFTALAGDV